MKENETELYLKYYINERYFSLTLPTVDKYKPKYF